MTRWWRRGRGGDAGSSALEITVLAPVLLFIFAMAISAMRIEIADQAIQSAAHDAARAASISRTEDQARTDARNTANTSLNDQGLNCRTLTVNVDTTGFGAPLGTPASVTVTVTCVVDLADVSMPGLPGAKTLTATFVSSIDSYRGRQ